MNDILSDLTVANKHSLSWLVIGLNRHEFHLKFARESPTYRKYINEGVVVGKPRLECKPYGP